MPAVLPRHLRSPPCLSVWPPLPLAFSVAWPLSPHPAAVLGGIKHKTDQSGVSFPLSITSPFLWLPYRRVDRTAVPESISFCRLARVQQAGLSFSQLLMNAFSTADAVLISRQEGRPVLGELTTTQPVRDSLVTEPEAEANSAMSLKGPEPSELCCPGSFSRRPFIYLHAYRHRHLFIEVPPLSFPFVLLKGSRKAGAQHQLRPSCPGGKHTPSDTAMLLFRSMLLLCY